MVTPFEAANAEHKGQAPTFEFGGQTFTAQDPGAMALIEWAAASDLDTESKSPAEIAAANAALFHMLEAVVADADWPRFRRLARARRASGDELLGAIRDASAALTGHPTEPPSGSPESPAMNGPLSTVEGGSLEPSLSNG